MPPKNPAKPTDQASQTRQVSSAPAMVPLNDLAAAMTSMSSTYLKMMLAVSAKGGGIADEILKIADCACQGRDCGCDGVFCGCDTRRNDPADTVSFPELLAQRDIAIAELQKQLAKLQGRTKPVK